MRYHQPDFGGWDLWRDGISVTALQTSLACFEQLRLGHCLRYQPRVLPIGPTFGKLIHHLLEKTQGFFDPRAKPPSPLEISLIAATWFKKQKKHYVGPKRREQLEHIVDVATAVFIGYAIRYRGDWMGKSKSRDSSEIRPSKWIGFEQSFIAPYTYPDGKTTEIRGRFDALCMRQKKGWVFETKCWSVIKPELIVAMLPWDFQYNLYLHTLSRNEDLLADFSIPKKVGGLILNVVRRPGHMPHVNETKKDFWNRLVKEVSSSSRWDHYFYRFPYEVTRKDMDNWRNRQLYPAMEMLRAWYEGRIPHFVNSTSLVTQYGPCFLFDPIANLDFSNIQVKGKRRGKSKNRSKTT